MPKPTCPSCQQTISDEDINVKKNTAFCRNCSSAHQFSGLLAQASTAERINPDDPPHGVRFENTGVSYVIKARHRSIGMGLFMLLFSAAWFSILSIFILTIIAGWISYAHGTIPNWFPSSTQTGPKEVGILIFMTIFLIPFLISGLIVLSLGLFSIFGQSTSTIRGQEGKIFSGIGPIGRTKRFNAEVVRQVAVEKATNTRRGQEYAEIVINTTHETVKLGRGLTQTQRWWIAGMLNQLLITSSEP